MRFPRFSLKTVLLLMLFLGSVLNFKASQNSWVLLHQWNTSRGFLEGYSPDGKLIITSSYSEPSISIWSTETYQLVHHLKTKDRITFPVRSIVFSPDGKDVVIGSNDEKVRVFEVASGKEKLLLDRHEEGRVFATYSPDGKGIATAGRDGRIIIWDTTTGGPKRVVEHGSGAVYLMFSPSGRYLLTVDDNNVTRILDLNQTETRNLFLFSNSEPICREVLWKEDSQSVYMLTRNGVLRCVKLDSGTSLELGRNTRQSLSGVRFSKDQKRFLTLMAYSHLEKAEIRDFDTGNCLGLLDLSSSGSYDPTRDRVATMYDGIVKIWIRAGSDYPLRFYQRFSFWLAVVIGMCLILSCVKDRSMFRRLLEER